MLSEIKQKRTQISQRELVQPTTPPHCPIVQALKFSKGDRWCGWWSSFNPDSQHAHIPSNSCRNVFDYGPIAPDCLDGSRVE